MAEKTTAAKAPTLEFSLRGADAAEVEVEDGAEVSEVPLAESLPVGVLWLRVVPKGVVDVSGVLVWVIVDPVPVTLPADVRVEEVPVDDPEVAEDTVEAALGPMLKDPVEANMSLISPMLTASRVYPAPTGTTGN